MKKKIVKIALVFSVIILVSAGCNKQVYQESQQVETKKEAQETVNNPEVKPTVQAQTRENAGGADYKPQIETAPILTVDQVVEGSSVNATAFPFMEGQTAYDVLTAIHKVEARDYGAMGQFVQSIDGVKADSKHFWEFWVNGKSSNVGASSYKLQNGDKLEWKLTVIK